MSEEQKRMLYDVIQRFHKNVELGLISQEVADERCEDLLSKTGQEIEEVYDVYKKYEAARTRHIATLSLYLHELVSDGVITDKKADAIYQQIIRCSVKELLEIIGEIDEYQNMPFIESQEENLSYVSGK